MCIRDSGNSTKSSDHDMNIFGFRIINQKSTERFHLYIRDIFRCFFQYSNTFLYRKQWSFLRVIQYTDSQLFKYFCCPPYNIQMPVGYGIKASGIDCSFYCAAFLQNTCLFVLYLFSRTMVNPSSSTKEKSRSRAASVMMSVSSVIYFCCFNAENTFLST